MFTLLTCKTGNIYKYTFSPLIFTLSLSLSLSLSFNWESSEIPDLSFLFTPPLPCAFLQQLINLKTRQPQSSIHPCHTKHSNPNPRYQKTTT
ncbi:hypothetical protein QC761_201975 [Podospora bellae-mahoneyi]|uniref:Uncharacterized protein n=1 Tax=Podospora bellae-mahoneyi TaxID=2093777 RepID=A0ABR0FNP5_9PEZI|nr:hypothetical protein QC761_201975 [Podospora bellae-mahoneyi]